MASLGVVRLGQYFPWKRKIYGKSVSTSFFFLCVGFRGFILERRLISHGKTKIQGKKTTIKFHGFTERTLRQFSNPKTDCRINNICM